MTNVNVILNEREREKCCMTMNDCKLNNNTQGTKMSLLERFKNREQAVISELLKQKIVNGNMEFAKEILQKGEVVGFESGDNIITQGEHDQDVYFIIAGNTSLIINGSELYSRGSGITIGEMSAINPSKARSATLIAKVETVTVKVNADSFTELLDKYPMAYKFLLIDYNSRMQEKNALIKNHDCKEYKEQQ